MTTQYEFRLLDLESPDGQIDADRLVDLLQSLKEVAVRVGRITTGSGSTGRPPREVGRLARLSIGLRAGSTSLQFSRAPEGQALDLELPGERDFDARFRDLIEGVARDVRPEWVDDHVADGAGGLVAALQRSAPQVELVVDGLRVGRFRSGDLHRGTWAPSSAGEAPELVTLTGVLDRVDLRSHRFRVRDDVGFDYALPRVADATAAGRLVGSRVVVTGWSQRDGRGGVTEVHQASLMAAPHVVGAESIPAPVSLEAILAAAPGPTSGPLADLGEDESESFLEAMGL